jgi:hypothetical protein
MSAARPLHPAQLTNAEASLNVRDGPQADLATVSDEAKRRVKYPEPTGGIVEDPNRPGMFLWSYEM